MFLAIMAHNPYVMDSFMYEKKKETIWISRYDHV